MEIRRCWPDDISDFVGRQATAHHERPTGPATKSARLYQLSVGDDVLVAYDAVARDRLDAYRDYRPASATVPALATLLIVGGFLVQIALPIARRRRARRR